MKGIFHIILATVLLLSTTGVSIHKHYCKDKIAGVSLFGQPKTCCGGKRKMPPGCCRDETEFHQLDDDFSITAHKVVGPEPVLVQLKLKSKGFPLAKVRLIQPEYLIHKPPNLHPDLYIWVASFLI